MNAVYLRDGKFDAMSRGDVRASFQEYRKSPSSTRLAFFFHGGLVDKKAGSQVAANEYETYKSDAFPLFFIWESGIWEVLGHHLSLIFAETIFGRLKSHAESLLARKIGLSPGAPEERTAGAGKFTIMSLASETADEMPDNLGLSDDDVGEFTSAIFKDPEIRAETLRICTTPGLGPNARADIMGDAGTLLAPSVVLAMATAFVEPVLERGSTQSLVATSVDRAVVMLASLAVRVLFNCIKRYVKNRDHGLTCTVVEEILRTLYGANSGSSIWAEMKRETEAAFGGDPELYGGTAVISELCELISERPDLKVTLVGHSTGGVYIGNFLRQADIALGGRAFEFDVILLAPANTFDFFSANYRRRVRALRLFGLTDEAEMADLLMSADIAASGHIDLLGHLYPRSLLYLVSGICETFDAPATNGPQEMDATDMPILGMARFFERTEVFKEFEYPSVAYVRTLFCSAPIFSRVLSPTSGDAVVGFRSGARKHGNFLGDSATIESLRHCLANGLS